MTTAIGNALNITVNSKGIITSPARPFFWAWANSTQSNVTGDGTTYTVQFNNIVQNIGTVFTSDNLFTAPVTGIYQFDVTLFITGASGGGGFTSTGIQLVQAGSVNIPFEVYYGNFLPGDSGGNIVFGRTVMLPAAANDTFQVTLLVTGGAKTIGVNNSQQCYFSGLLVG